MLGTTELVILLVIVLLIFGVGRISKIAGELGQGIKSFRSGISDNETVPSNEEKGAKE
ncbi:MAG: twin-arginine translocase TatA/TatE family subunit [Anaerolineae bacterium]|jgi:sec-independent protein translocase protein TatA|nr:twin-arginine translocase TatA/TatE family subunit [Anaerolineae bacterium]